MALFGIRDVTIGFGGYPVLDHLDLQVEVGDRLCLIGRNGSGKSTLIRMIMSELSPDSGEVWRKQGLRISCVPQEVPGDLSGAVFDIVAGGLGEKAALLAEYHDVACKISAEGGDGFIQQLTALQKKLEETDAWSLNQEVERVLCNLHLDADADFASLSGGTKRRVLLARALVASPDILLLDEPTNHLDINSIIWLEEYLLKNVKTLLFVTHDRAFARHLANRVAELDRGRLYSFTCGYDSFVERREELLEAEMTRLALFDRKLSQEEEWVRKGIKARRTRNEGRVRALKQMREERRKRRDRPGNLKMQLQNGELSGRLVAEAAEVSFGYGASPVIRNLSVTIMRGDRIGIIGPNGSGKSTLLRLLLGQLEPQNGNLRLGTRLQVLYFDQLREQLDPAATVQETVGEGNDTLIINGKSRHVIGYLQDFLFSPERARTPVGILSGGEKNRLLLAKLFCRPSNLLVMDEPTNDLDAETLGLLEELLLEYSGTVLLVSHDRDFLNNVVTSTLVLDGKGEVQEFVGGYDDWLEQSVSAQPEAALKPSVQVRKVREKRDVKRLSFKEERELDALPDAIAELEKGIELLHQKLSDPSFYRDSGKEVGDLKEMLAKREEELSLAYGRWEELEALRG